MEVGEEGSLYLSLHCHHQNDSCFNTDSDEPYRLTMAGAVSWCLTSTETIRIIRDGEKGGREVRRYGGGGRGRLYTYRYTVTTRMTPALRWAAMRAILMFP